jgi:hypothetical protein
VKLQKKASWWNRKYRGATKEGHRGENKNIVAHQKKGIVVKTKISWCNKRRASR